MTRRVQCGLAALAAAGCVVGRAARAESFTIPAPGNGPPVSQVQVILEFGADVTGTPSITVNGAVTPLGGAALTADGDVISLTSLGLRRVRLNVLANSQLLFPGDSAHAANFCTPSASAGAKTYTFTMSGFPPNPDYRMSGYTGVAGGDCKCRTRRVKTVVWNTPPGGANKGRLPLDLVLVLDRSGSMGATDASGLTRWQSLQSAVGAVISVWQMEGLGAGGFDLGQDRLGLTYFSTQDQPYPGPPLSTLSTRATAGAWDGIKQDIASKHEDASTALGLGLRQAVKAWQADMKNDPVFLVMSDGIQNQPPPCPSPSATSGCVNEGTGAHQGLELLDVDGTGDKPLTDLCIPMLTVALGSTPGSSYDTLLDAISMQTSGAHRLATAGSVQLTDSFVTSLVEALKGNTLSMALRTSGTSVEAPIDTTVQLDKTIRGAIAMVTYEASTRGVLRLRFVDPHGHTYGPVASQYGRGYAIYRLDVGAANAGTWHVQVTRDASGAIPYSLTILTDETSLDLDLRFRGVRHETGDPLLIDGLISFDGKAVNDAVLRVAAETPAGAFGTILHDDTCDPACPSGQVCANHACIAIPSGGSPGADQPDPLQARLDAIASNPGFGGKDAGTLKLASQGNGRYTVSLANTRLPGRYAFLLSLDWTSPGGDVIHRQHFIEGRVEVKPDPAASAIATRNLGGGVWTVLVDPRDRFGNWQGPGYDTRLRVTAGGGVTVDPATRDPGLTGSYVARLGSVTGDPTVSVSFGGVPIKTAPLSQLDQRSHVKPSCAHCGGGGALAAVVPLMALGWRRRRRT